MTRYWLIGLTILAAVVSTAVPAIAQDDGRLTVRFYSVQDLLTPRHGYRFNGHVLPGVDPAAEYRSEADGAFIGQGIVPNQPGGFFAVQDRVAAQAGDGRGVNGASLNMASTTAIAGVGNPHGIAIDDLMSVIARTVEPAQWETEGGSNVLDFLGGRLVVRATNDTHAAIEEFLKQLRLTTRHRVPVHIEAYWIKVDRSEAIGFPTTGAELEAVVGSPAIAGRVSCLNGQTVTICAGRRESVTTEVIAVVGDENAAYQPQTVYPNIGALLEVKPLLLENGKKVIVDIHSTVSESDGNLTLRKHGDILLDHPTIDSHQIGTTIVAPVGELFVAGGMTMRESHNVFTMFLVMRVTK